MTASPTMTDERTEFDAADALAHRVWCDVGGGKTMRDRQMIRAGVSAARVAPNARIADLETRLAAAETLLNEAEELIWTANWAAGKLNVEMIHRRTIECRAEFAELVEKREAMARWRAARSASSGAGKP